MISVEEALRYCLDLAGPALDIETIGVSQAYDRYMPASATARCNQPPFDASAMDGYALPSIPMINERFTVVGEIAAGHSWQGTPLQLGQAIRIFTGAPVPENTKCVIIQENAASIPETDDIIVHQTGGSNDHIRRKGQDFCFGDQVSPRKLGPSDLALLAGMNIPTVEVTRRPRIAIIATGDELVLPKEGGLVSGQIISSTPFALKPLCEKAGAEVFSSVIARDNAADIESALHAASNADLILTLGGVSVGDHDLIVEASTNMGLKRTFWKVAMRPGKPLMAGKLGKSALLGLPGNPASSLVCARLFVLPMIRAMLGYPADMLSPSACRAVLDQDLPENGARAHYMRAHAVFDAETMVPHITVCDRQDSSLLSVMAKANALLIHPAHSAMCSKGKVVNYIPL